ncbi:macrolide ABC transporter ATP-binding protein/permease MacB [Burkholderia pseudomallei]|uniref:macrolide ABC transporter ATP-binding protein/permease MacB n=1 Tax=Burkholderia pseudomallei TaxID=28450 RepID=UPI0005E33EC8|nr:macrolide ABC transporter ATP-binding protein/permease MacB [Burkholderia pseudomallei]QGS81428.1 macrolide ABC transporter ATP-binding protein/permease MacB [Burkholderia pseudomallei]CAJ9560950.1 macrolide-specific ABC-type efflux carrier [Burkholderia pseudomallei]CAK1283118.1 macrolide-specific ABC-type efflux carrier [Burkholderia pseudomallei]CFK36285.1 macrolide-specific ABC-type efflux carrier [Burkholderia pseudomallei]CFL11905.1 macrolide-specific ABC-type efflux carrier [Burkhold
MTGPLLQLTRVTRRFPAGEKDVVVLDDVSLSIDAGEIVAIVGASGSGKSTLMNILGCLDHPSSGSYTVGGRETSELESDELARLRREHFGFIFQRYHLLPHLCAAENIEMPAVYAGSAQAQRRERALALLARLGLSDRASHRPSQLSGGQQQRVSIARALMNGGEVILADEPTGALDSKSGRDVIRVLRELNALGHTVIIVTHDEQVAAHARRIIEISDGRIVGDRLNPHADAADAAPDASGGAQPRRARRLSAGVGRFAEAFRMAWIALVSHRLRTLLTMLGIIIGITSVVSIVAIGEGAKRYMLDEIGSIGTNTINVYPGADWGDSRADAIQTLVAADAAALAEQIYIDSATPETSRSLLLRYRNVDVNALVSGVGERFFQVRGMKLAQGIAFGADEVRRQAQVAVIDENTRRKLFGANPNPLGEVILIDNLPCVVIGVTASKKSAFGDMKNLNVWVPYTTASGRLFGQRHLDSITVRVRDGQPSDAAERSLTKLMLQRHGRKDFFTYNMDSVVKTVEKTGQSLTLLLSLIAVISLVVGGIGVMNIMLVSVTERTREIGIRMAVGARQTDIMQQFLVEAVTVCLMGGAIGIVLSFGMSFVFSLFVDQWKMVFSAASIASAFLCSTLIGVVFGFMPARNASRLDPIDALARD